NGTCQLSSQVIDGTESSPAGTIFDPDFDLYERKTSNCLVDPGPNNGIYATNAPSLHHPDRYFTHTDHFWACYPAGRYSDSGINLPKL
ncbi:hypothetical protein PVAND_017819, partial [Polypedilum vanderplanki]